MNRTYQSIAPNASKATYNPGDTVEFQIPTVTGPDGDGLYTAMEMQSIKIVGKLTVTPGGAGGGAGAIPSVGLQYDPDVGMNGLFSQSTCSSSLVNFTRTLDNLQQIVKLIGISKIQTDKISSSTIASEQVTSQTFPVNAYLTGNAGAPFNYSPSFSISPFCTFNYSDGHLCYDKFGNLSIRLIISSFKDLFWETTAGASPSSTYSVSGLYLTYNNVSVPASYLKLPTTFFSPEVQQKTLDTGTASFTFIGASGSGGCIGILSTFAPTLTYRNGLTNNTILADPHFASVQYKFDSNGSKIRYPLESREEILNTSYQALNALRETVDRATQVDSDLLQIINGVKFFLGFKFSQLENLSMRPFEIVLQVTPPPAGTALTSYNMYTFFMNYFKV